MKKKITSIVGAILIVVLIWYLFIKPYDYLVTFKTKTSPGTLFSGLEEWNLINQKQDSFSYQINQKTPYTFISETLQKNKRNLKLDWNFNSLNDSITQVEIGIIEKENSIYNRLSAPFFNTVFKRLTIDLIQDYKKGIEYQLKEKFKVTYPIIDTIPEIVYAYIELKNIDMRNKAEQMMKNNATLLTFLNEHNIKGGEFPFLIIDNWNINRNTIDFRYCFPVKQSDSIYAHKDIKFDKRSPQKALKAIYNGNYITSDRGWFALYEYAKRHGISVEYKPVEIFYNNPFYGGNELEWKTEVYMPIQ